MNTDKKNWNLICPDLGMSEGVFPTQQEAVAWARKYNMRYWHLAPTDRECWTRW